MKIAIIGAGVSGLAAGHYLSNQMDSGHHRHALTIFEANSYAGGHTDTHEFEIEGKSIRVDSGFIVFNEDNYPNFTALLKSLGVAWQNSDMSFSAVNEASGFCYGADGFKRLFAQKRNLINPQFYRMLWDLIRFYRQAPKQLANQTTSITLGEYLAQQGYSRCFIDNHIIPMACALWSGPAATIEQFPLNYFLSFMNNHRMLQIFDRPQWKTVSGGSNRYVDEIVNELNGTLRLNSPVKSVKRSANQVTISTEAYGDEIFDTVIFACHSDQALRLLQDATTAEQEILGAIEYQSNHVVVHTDNRFLPPLRAAWASWNARIPATEQHQCSVSYWMNLLQQLPVKTPIIVTLNPKATACGAVAADRVLAERHYSHPIYTQATLNAQRKKDEINGRNNTYFVGAYWGWGFHEDGVRSAVEVAQMIDGSSC